MQQQIAICGLVATTPRHLIRQDGLPITSFRMASNLDDESTNWYTVNIFNELAYAAAGSFNKADRVIVIGELRVRDWDNGERAGTSVDIVATAVGHDLNFGIAEFTRKSFKKEEANS